MEIDEGKSSIKKETQEKDESKKVGRKPNPEKKVAKIAKE